MTQAYTTWRFDGRYSYPLGHTRPIYSGELDILTDSQRVLIFIEKVEP